MGHIHMMVADPEAHKKLWVGVMGAEVVHAGTLEMLKLPGVFLVIGKARTPPTEGTPGSTVNHFGVSVPSYPAIKAKMQELGLPLVQDNTQFRQIIVRELMIHPAAADRALVSGHTNDRAALVVLIQRLDICERVPET